MYVVLDHPCDFEISSNGKKTLGLTDLLMDNSHNFVVCLLFKINFSPWSTVWGGTINVFWCLLYVKLCCLHCLCTQLNYRFKRLHLVHLILTGHESFKIIVTTAVQDFQILNCIYTSKKLFSSTFYMCWHADLLMIDISVRHILLQFLRKLSISFCNICFKNTYTSTFLSPLWHLCGWFFFYSLY